MPAGAGASASDADARDAATDGGSDAATDTDVVVIGAGITGLALTHALAERGVPCVTLEAGDEAGGVIDSKPLDDGLVAERGPNRIRLTDGIEALVEAAGLRADLVVADDDLPLYVYADGALREVPFDLSTFLRTDLLPWHAKLRVLAEPLTGDVRPDESVGRAIRRAFGTTAYRNLVEPIYGGTYGSDPDRMPVKRALPALLRMQDEHGNLLRPLLRRATGEREAPPPVTIAGGLQRLPRALAERHADRVRLDTPATGIERDGERYAVSTPDGEILADDVVLTVPAPAAADLLEGVAPDSAAALAELRYNPLAVVTMYSDARRDGFGYQVRRTESLRTLGVSWHHSLFGRTGQYTAFLGGMEDERIVEAAPDDIGDIAADEFEAVMDAAAHVRDVWVDRRALPAYDESWAALDRLALPAGLTLATNYTARVGVPGRVREAERVADDLA
ncbi:oxygen-dependent protoporphyrinogen oxidase [Halarchaeum rubridurum]|uniref:Protoporphyrinogen oxidase n=1 Tax=Halarchaeum rubridurum TaxID=489911 RepID=A0A830FYH2_9EURY|nr:protoporphyrinogen oxidase [Halarchaeum rubridurum]MBP1954401.1 oxygen-dependent protoporphyrinogen oxidase [Halarchaeum rubridurum]GGM60679.1 protoporphyrinogen oxidase [Halarchaeum rubridurum]